MCQCKLCLCVFLCLFVYRVSTFNVDSFNYALYESPYTSDGRSSMFGFSVALHRERNNGWLIVGAPEAQSSQPGVYHGGAVYKCPTDRDGGCEEIPFDTKGNNRDNHNNMMDNKTEQWFGATVSSSGREEGPIVACAPRYTWFPNGRSRRDPVGTCYVSNGQFADFNEYSPCRTYQWGYHRQGSCQAGFSAAINTVGDRLFIGSPGSWYWQGQMYSIDAHATFDFKPSLFSATYGHEGQVHQQSLESRPAVFSTTEGTDKDDDSYMGYSTITGDFLGNGEEGIAVGMPRGNDLRGKVLLFTWNLTNFLFFTSDQIGSYYGYALAAVDVDGDSKLDLVVGAPMYTVQDNKEKYDVGRVYVIYQQSAKGRFEATDIIDGFSSKSRFGQALGSLGDINQDGYEDFAVGAPYGGDNYRGAVYIYHGSSKGVRKEFSQVIFAEDVVPQAPGSLTTFGFSITGGLDLDNNQYPDMAVGAYNSNKAFFFRSRPVIKVEASVKFLSKSVNIINTDHTLRSDRSAATKTKIQFCSKYSGKGIPSNLKLGVEYILDTKKLVNPRMGFVDDESQNRKNTTITLLRDREMKCEPPVDVYVRSDIRDKLTSLVVEAKYWLRDDQDLASSYLQRLPRNPTAELLPVFDLNSPPTKKDSISIQKNCGDDNVCIPNLDLVVNPSVQEYYLDSKEKFFLDITVSNSGEDAFESTLEVQYPDGFFFSTSTDLQVVSHVLCSSGENNTIKCDIGNPIPHNKIVHFRLFWQADHAKELPSKLYWDISVNSTNEEPVVTRGNNKRRVEISILYDVIQEIRGYSIPSEVVFTPTSSLYAEDISNQTQWTLSKDRLSENSIGPQVIHVYELKNGGKTTIKATEIFFVWPATTATGEDFLYLMDPPHFSFTEGLNLKCGPIAANYRDFEVVKLRKSVWELYDINVNTDNHTGITSSQVGATIGGQTVTSNEKLDKVVSTGGGAGSPTVTEVRQNKTISTQIPGAWQQEQSIRIQILEANAETDEKLASGSYRHAEIGGRDYIYRCLRKDNGREIAVDCGSDLLLKTGPGLLLQAQAQYQEEGNIQYWCLELDGDEWKKVRCEGAPRIPVAERQEESKVTVQVLSGDQALKSKLEGGKFEHKKIQGGDFVYRCFRKRNGIEEEIDCGNRFSFSSVDLPWILDRYGTQQENLRYTCLEPDSQGRLQRVECRNVPKINIKVEKTVTTWGDNGTTTTWGQNSTSSWQKNGSTTWQPTYIAPAQHFNKVQVFQGDEQIRQRLEGGIYRYQLLDGRMFIYRCFHQEREVDCGEDFSLSRLNIVGLLQRTGIQQDDIRYTCLEPDGRGSLRYVPCGALPKVIIRTVVTTHWWKSNTTHYWNESGVFVIPQTYDFDIVQVIDGGQEVISQLTGNYRMEKIEGNRGFLCRCFRNFKQIDCGENFSLAGINVIVLMRRVSIHREGSIRYFCLQQEQGQWHEADCSRLPRIQTIRPYQQQTVAPPRTYEAHQQILRRCLKLVNGDWKEVDCRTGKFQDGSTFVEQCFHTVNGQRRTIKCDEVPAGAIFTDIYAQNKAQQSGQSSYDYSYGRSNHSQTYGGTATQQNVGTQRGYDYSYGRGNNHSYEEGYEESYGYDDEEEEGYSQEETSRRADARNRIVDNGGGRGFTTSVLDLGSFNNVGDNVPTSSPSSRTWHHGRRKRQIIGDDHPSIAKIEEKYPCENLKCVYMRCTIGNLEHGKPLMIALRGRLNAKVLRNMKLDNQMQFSSMMITRVHKVPHLMSIEDSKMEVQEVETVVKIPEEIKSETVPLWVVVLSAVAGTIILLLLIFLLYKLGFFKRNRPSTAPERQPLNRNGYHHGDEAL